MAEKKAFSTLQAFPFSNDSGYIIKQNFTGFLWANKLLDTTSNPWKALKINDTIGKYYKTNTGNYFTCTAQYVDSFGYDISHLIMEVRPNGQVLHAEAFGHGEYLSCWQNIYGGFKKVGGYYTFSSCGTGSAYSGSELYVFDKITPAEKQNPIPIYFFSGDVGGKITILESTREIENGSILVHYTYKKGVERKDHVIAIKHLKKFEVKFIMKNDKWEATDSSELKKVWM